MQYYIQRTLNFVSCMFHLIQTAIFYLIFYFAIIFRKFLFLFVLECLCESSSNSRKNSSTALLDVVVVRSERELTGCSQAAFSLTLKLSKLLFYSYTSIAHLLVLESISTNKTALHNPYPFISVLAPLSLQLNQREPYSY